MKVDILGTLLEEDRLEEIAARLPEVAKKFPNSPTVLYLQGVLESDARRALDYFTKLIKLHPDSEYADRAAIRIAQYHFAQGSYVTAAKYFKSFLKDYPASKLCSHAAYHEAQCYLAQDRGELARSLLLQFIQDYPSSPLSSMAILDLEDLEKDGISGTSFPEIDDKKPSGKKIYTVQIGAFSKKENAMSLVKKAMEMGYDVEGFRKGEGANRVYVVWVGAFPTRPEAQKFAREFKKKHNMDYIVVLKSD